MEKIKYFDKPTQVMFVKEDGEWEAGIAYCDEIICSCCGCVLLIEEIYADCPKNIKNPIRPYSKWVNLSEDIIGGELPTGLTVDEEWDIIEEENNV